MHEHGFISCCLLVIFILVCILYMPICHLQQKSDIQAFKEAKQTYEFLIEMGDVERAAAITYVMKWNTWLAKAQYWNSTLLCGPYWTDEVDQLKPIGKH